MSERKRYTPGTLSVTKVDTSVGYAWKVGPVSCCLEEAEAITRLIAVAPDMVNQLEDLLDCAKTAIHTGDWKVDGACDPDITLMRCDNLLAKIYGDET